MSPMHTASWLGGDVRLVLVTPREKSLVVDALVDSQSSGLGAVGWPLSIEVERADTAWFDTAVEHMLIGWAHEARVVTVEVGQSANRPEARLASGGASLRAHLVRIG